MSGADHGSAPEEVPDDSNRAVVRRIGRRRVVSAGPAPGSDASSAPGGESALQTSDDTDAGWGEAAAGAGAGAARDDDARARWLRAERPPHWG